MGNLRFKWLPLPLTSQGWGHRPDPSSPLSGSNLRLMTSHPTIPETKRPYLLMQ